MTNNGVITKRLYDCTFTICSYCMYRKTIKLPCKTKKSRSINEYKPVASVSDCVSVDVLLSSTTGLIAHMYGFNRHQRYQYAWVLVDHHSDFTDVHLLNSQTGDEAGEVKKAFEAYVEFHGVDIKYYHAENGISEVHFGWTTARICIRDSLFMEEMLIIEMFERSCTSYNYRTWHAVRLFIHIIDVPVK